jgi:hypothetical protein
MVTFTKMKRVSYLPEEGSEMLAFDSDGKWCATIIKHVVPSRRIRDRYVAGTYEVLLDDGKLEFYVSRMGARKALRAAKQFVVRVDRDRTA